MQKLQGVADGSRPRERGFSLSSRLIVIDGAAVSLDLSQAANRKLTSGLPSHMLTHGVAVGYGDAVGQRSNRFQAGVFGIFRWLRPNREIKNVATWCEAILKIQPRWKSISLSSIRRPTRHFSRATPHPEAFLLTMSCSVRGSIHRHPRFAEDTRPGSNVHRARRSDIPQFLRRCPSPGRLPMSKSTRSRCTTP